MKHSSKISNIKKNRLPLEGKPRETKAEIKQKNENNLRKTKCIILSTENSSFLFSHETIDVIDIKAVNISGIVSTDRYLVSGNHQKKKKSDYLAEESYVSF